jgi:nicotinamide mononucleotide transporter
MTAAGSLGLCAAYVGGARLWAPESMPKALEVVGTALSFWSVWLSQRRNVLAPLVGVLASVVMGFVFYGVSLVGQTMLQWVYFVPIQLWTWASWTRGGPNGGELSVTRLKLRGRILAVALTCALTGVLGVVLDVRDDSRFVYWDASIAASSVMALYLMSIKKVEAWWFWTIPIDLSAVGLNLNSGTYMLSVLYGIFFVMGCFGWHQWHRAAAWRTA